MKSSASLALAIGLGAAGITTYWLISRQPAPGNGAVSDDSAIVASPSATVHPGTSQDPASVQTVAGTKSERTPAANTDLGRAVSQHGLSRMQALLALASAADVDTLPQLVSEASAIGNAADRRDSLDVLLMRWFELAPQSAPQQLLNDALRAPAGAGRSDRLTSIASAWAQVDAESAWRHVAAIEDISARALFGRAVLQVWSESDPQQALNGVVALAPGAVKDGLLKQAASNLARTDPASAIALANRLKRSDGRPVLAAIVGAWADHDPAAAAQWMIANPGKLNRMYAQQIASRYGAVNPMAAMAWALKMDRSGNRGVMGQALAGYADEHPQEALRLALSLESSVHRGEATGQVLAAIARRDPEFAKANLDKVPAGRYRSQAANQIAMQLASIDPRSAVDWARGLDEPGSRRSALASIGSSLAENDPDAAAALIDQVPAEARTQWVSSVGLAYAGLDPDKAQRWLKGFQSDPSYSQMLAQLLPQLSQLDASGAFELAAAIQDVELRDRAVMQIAMVGGARDPESAQRFIEKISNENMRQNAVSQVAASWARNDLTAARRWVGSLDSGALRDHGLSAIVSSATLPLDDTLSLIGQIQSSDPRSDAVWQSAVRLAGYDIEAARTLVRRYPLDPSRMEILRSQVRQQYSTTL